MLEHVMDSRPPRSLPNTSASARFKALLSCYHFFSNTLLASRKYIYLLYVKVSNRTTGWIFQRLLRTRAVDIDTRLDRIVDGLLIDLCGSSDYCNKGALMILVRLLEGKRKRVSSLYRTLGIIWIILDISLFTTFL
ncbi:hypothetical protein GX48_06144 [Paracoccidioides brasiliensis]|nr:hypothetical protein GX48_06144 [Paracoccidioides brasiliensis]